MTTNTIGPLSRIQHTQILSRRAPAVSQRGKGAEVVLVSFQHTASFLRIFEGGQRGCLLLFKTQTKQRVQGSSSLVLSVEGLGFRAPRGDRQKAPEFPLRGWPRCPLMPAGGRVRSVLGSKGRRRVSQKGLGLRVSEKGYSHRKVPP